MEAYGIDWDGPLSQEPSDSRVSVPETQSVLSDQEMQRLLNLVDPLSLSNCYGIDLYMQTRALISHLSILADENKKRSAAFIGSCSDLTAQSPLRYACRESR